MTNLLTLTTPLMRQTIGFDRFSDMFERMLNDAEDSVDNYPPYNIEKHGEDEYRIVMAVAGFTMDDLELILTNGELAVSGHIKEKEDEAICNYLHKGIATRSFRRTFRLADFVEVKGADMNDGLLTIYLERVVPEESKPRNIPIKSASANMAIENKSKADKAKKK